MCGGRGRGLQWAGGRGRVVGMRDEVGLPRAVAGAVREGAGEVGEGGRGRVAGLDVDGR